MVVLVGLSLVASFAAVGARFVSLPYDSIGPGSARAVNNVVTVTGHPSYPPRGQLLYTTVAVRERVNPYEALAGWLDPDTDVIPEEKVRGDISTDEFKQLNIEAMADSKTTAELLALRHLGFEQLGDGAEIVDVEQSLPAAALLRAGDVIVGIDDRPVAESRRRGRRPSRPGRRATSSTCASTGAATWWRSTHPSGSPTTADRCSASA